MPDDLDEQLFKQQFASLDDDGLPVVAPPVGWPMQTGLGADVDRAASMLSQLDRNQLQYLLDRGRVRVGLGRNDSVAGSYGPDGIQLNPLQTAARWMARALAHELQHSRQPAYGGTERPLPTPLLVPAKSSSDEYRRSPREIEANRHEEYLKVQPEHGAGRRVESAAEMDSRMAQWRLRQKLDRY
jgi:hypothetical protein